MESIDIKSAALIVTQVAIESMHNTGDRAVQGAIQQMAAEIVKRLEESRGPKVEYFPGMTREQFDTLVGAPRSSTREEGR